MKKQNPEEETTGLAVPPDETFLQKTIRFFLKELQGITAVFYGSLVAVGMLFTYKKYAIFGINIFEYADIFDFLLAPFADWTIFLYVGVSGLLIWLFFKGDSWTRVHRPKLHAFMNMGLQNKSWYDSYRIISFYLVFIFYVWQSSNVYMYLYKNAVKERPPILLKYVDNHTVRGIPIGKTKEVLFLWKGETVLAIPMNASVKEFEIN